MSRFISWALGLGTAALLLPVVGRAEPTMMPPFLVEEPVVAPEWHWIHATDGQFEVLSACSLTESQNFMRLVRRRVRALERVVPDDFQQHTTLPTTLILFPSSQKKSLGEEFNRLLGHSGEPDAPRGRFQAMEDLRLVDADSSAIFVFLEEWQWEPFSGQQGMRPTSIMFSPGYLRFLLQARTPALPDWYVSGMVSFYSSITLYHTDFLAGGLAAPLWDRFEADQWTSEEMAHVLSRHPEAPRSLVPLQELFVAIQPAGHSQAYRETWEAEAELFVRWALSPKVKNGREKLLAFVSGCVSAQPTEQVFTAAFGLGYADALEELSDFLPAAVRDPVDLAYLPPRLEPPLEFRDATAVEIHRIKGDWSRRTLKLLRQSAPGSVAPFVEETRHLLQGPYDRGERDPRLLASLALFRIETGDQAGAAALLASDPKVSGARPLGEVELALWRLEQALAKPEGGHGTLSAAQAEGVLAPLDLARRQAPPIEATYLIAARLAEHSGHMPSAEERARLNEGARLFPRDSILVIKSAAWDLRAGEYSTALQLTALGLAGSNDAETLAKLTTLRNLAAKVASTAAPVPGS